jgi:hypothetical protein
LLSVHPIVIGLSQPFWKYRLPYLSFPTIMQNSCPTAEPPEIAKNTAPKKEVMMCGTAYLLFHPLSQITIP